MIGGVDNSGSLAYEAMLAALRSQSGAQMRAQADALGPAASESIAVGKTGQASGTDFVGALTELVKDGIDSVNASAADVDRIVPDMLSGKIEDLHEVASRINQADLTLRFSLEVRNKLIDAYREVMRMSV